MQIKTSNFGIINNLKVQLFTLINKNNVEVKITNYGGIITSINTPDINNNSKNIILGFDSLDAYTSKDYLASYPYFGAIIGRVANRISNGKFELDAKQYSVAKNNDNNHLHGGLIGFDRVIWDAKSFKAVDKVGVILSYLSVDGEEGYPGNLKVKVEYSLNNENELSINYFAETNAATPINLTQHSYFNLGDEATIKNHYLQLNCDKYTEIDSELIPTGNMISVKHTPYDFNKIKRIGNGFKSLKDGYDTNFDLNNDKGVLIKAGELYEPTSKRLLEVFTTEAGIQVYSGGSIPKLKIDGEDKFGKFSGVALETQHFPDALHHPNFQSIILNPGEKYQQQTIYKFSVVEKSI